MDNARDSETKEAAKVRDKKPIFGWFWICIDHGWNCGIYTKPPAALFPEAKLDEQWASEDTWRQILPGHRVVVATAWERGI